MKGSTNGQIERAKPIAQAVTGASSEVAGRVFALARGIKYNPNPRRSQVIFGLKVGMPAIAVGALAGYFARKIFSS